MLFYKADAVPAAKRIERGLGKLGIADGDGKEFVFHFLNLLLSRSNSSDDVFQKLSSPASSALFSFGHLPSVPHALPPRLFQPAAGLLLNQPVRTDGLRQDGKRKRSKRYRGKCCDGEQNGSPYRSRAKSLHAKLGYGLCKALLGQSSTAAGIYHTSPDTIPDIAVHFV